MEEKLEEILAQYELVTYKKRRVRGAYLLDTDRGLFTLRNYRGNVCHLDFVERVKQSLVEMGYESVDFALVNQKGEYLTRDNQGNDWMIKRWFLGQECDIREQNQVCQAMAHLGRLHKLLEIVGKNLESDRQTREADKELEAAEIPSKQGKDGFMEPNPPSRRPQNAPENPDYFYKRNRELKRIHNFIRKKRRKSEMELLLLNSFSYFYEQAKKALEIDEINQDYQNLFCTAVTQNQLIHGNYNYHNILFEEGNIATTNFDYTKVGIAVLDLYGFLRKCMEKNNWNLEFGKSVLFAYEKERPLSEEEKRLLYSLLIFPEKYWKQCNFYYNTNKAWMPVKNYEKLQKLKEQEPMRSEFLDSIKSLFI